MLLLCLEWPKKFINLLCARYFWRAVSSSPAVFIYFALSCIKNIHEACGKKGLEIFSQTFSCNNNNSDSWLPSYLYCFCTCLGTNFHQMLILHMFVFMFSNMQMNLMVVFHTLQFQNILKFFLAVWEYGFIWESPAIIPVLSDLNKIILAIDYHLASAVVWGRKCSVTVFSVAACRRRCLFGICFLSKMVF